MVRKGRQLKNTEISRGLEGRGAASVNFAHVAYATADNKNTFTDDVSVSVIVHHSRLALNQALQTGSSRRCWFFVSYCSQWY